MVPPGHDSVIGQALLQGVQFIGVHEDSTNVLEWWHHCQILVAHRSANDSASTGDEAVAIAEFLTAKPIFSVVAGIKWMLNRPEAIRNRQVHGRSDPTGLAYAKEGAYAIVKTNVHDAEMWSKWKTAKPGKTTPIDTQELIK